MLHWNRSRTSGNSFQKFPRSRELRNGYETFQNLWERYRELRNFLGTWNCQIWERGNLSICVPSSGSFHTLLVEQERLAVPNYMGPKFSAN